MLGSGHILVVDDDPGVRDGLRALLEAEGWQVRAVDGGAAAIAAITEQRPAMALVDVYMPRVDGLALTRWIRSNVRRFIPVILLTGSGEPEIVDRGIDAGGDEVLRKPIDATELRLRMRAMLRIGEMAEELRAAKRNLVRVALTDELTGVTNLRGFRASLSRELHRRARRGGDVTLSLLDVDHFKAINDTHGHPAGDVVLAEVARGIVSAAREMDLVARVGGDEFVVLSPGADAAVALPLGERLRSAVARSAVALPDGRTVSVTLTCGVASAGQIDACTPDLLLATADAALYQAKASGRNCTVQAKEAVRPSSPASQRLQQNGIVSEIIEDESSLVGIDDD